MEEQYISHKQWLKRAKSNLARARSGKLSDDILWEDLCFDTQQAVEKALKALLSALQIEFPRTHSIGLLLDILNDAGIEIPQNINYARKLTYYAVETRYPMPEELLSPVNEIEFNEALAIAEEVYIWVEKIIQKIENEKKQ